MSEGKKKAALAIPRAKLGIHSCLVAIVPNSDLLLVAKGHALIRQGISSDIQLVYGENLSKV